MWARASGFPGGRTPLIRRTARYTGSIGADQTPEHGRAVVTMADKAKVRNHLNSIHAIALIASVSLATGRRSCTRWTDVVGAS